MIRFRDVPVDTEFFELDHLGDEIRYKKTNSLGRGGMLCNAISLTERVVEGVAIPPGTPCCVPHDREVIVE